MSHAAKQDATKRGYEMETSRPSDFVPLKEWFVEFGRPVFSSDKLLHYHTKPIQKELMEAGAMAKVGVNVFLNKKIFWQEYQRIMAQGLDRRPA